ncbi:MAG: hypothetical protein P1P84_17745 [Deferrisomatales bacterium]|nr:hypothetical protein [Deferrisomatales bacterium]
MLDGETLAKGWIWIFTVVGGVFALRGILRRRRRRGAAPPSPPEE